MCVCGDLVVCSLSQDLVLDLQASLHAVFLHGNQDLPVGVLDTWIEAALGGVNYDACGGIVW